MILRITIIGLLAGVIGTGLGGIISALFKRNVDRYLDFFMGLSGGIMLAVVVFDLMKESMNEIGVLPTVIFTFVGVLLTMFLKTKLDMSKEMKAGYLIFISILLHNLPEGLAIGSSFMSTETLGMTLAIVIGIHNVPEGLAMALSLVGSRMKISCISSWYNDVCRVRRDIPKVKKLILYNRFFNWNNNCILHLKMR